MPSGLTQEVLFCQGLHPIFAMKPAVAPKSTAIGSHLVGRQSISQVYQIESDHLAGDVSEKLLKFKISFIIP